MAANEPMTSNRLLMIAPIVTDLEATKSEEADAFRLCASHPVEDDHRRLRRQRIPGHPETSFHAPVDLELLADALHEIIERGGEAVHRQHDRGAQPLGDLGDAVERHGVGAVDRHHHDVEPPDLGKMAVVELVVKMAEMADAEARDLEDENGVAVTDHVGAGIVAEIAADGGRDVANEVFADSPRHDGRLSVLAPAMQHTWNALVGISCRDIKS